MKKISTLFKKDQHYLGIVMNEINPENQWVFDGESIATRKFDGTAAAIIEGRLYKRYDAKKGKQVPKGAIPCQNADIVTGHHPHWVKCNRDNPEDKYHYEAFDLLQEKKDGTYELCGEKINGNPEKIKGHQLIKHGCEVIILQSLSYLAVKIFLCNPENNIEGIVFHHIKDGRMCKIRKSDFGCKRL